MKKVLDLAKFIYENATNQTDKFDEQLSIDRLKICEICENFNNYDSICNKCGCFMKMKSLWKEAKCPINKW